MHGLGLHGCTSKLSASVPPLWLEAGAVSGLSGCKHRGLRSSHEEKALFIMGEGWKCSFLRSMMTLTWCFLKEHGSLTPSNKEKLFFPYYIYPVSHVSFSTPLMKKLRKPLQPPLFPLFLPLFCKPLAIGIQEGRVNCLLLIPQCSFSTGTKVLQPYSSFLGALILACS